MGFFSKLFGQKQSKKIDLVAPFDCKVEDISKSVDESFAKGIIGKGVLLKPTQTAKTTKILAPCDGSLMTVVPTGRAYG